DYLLESPHLNAADKQFFNTVFMGTHDQSILEQAIQRLTQYLYKHHRAKVWLLIDEYDTPIHSAYLHGYYQEMVGIMRGMFGAALKTNPYLEKAVITGILRIAKESLFSGLNNVQVYTLLQSNYSEYFGFTESEVNDLLHQSGLDKEADAIRGW